MGTPRKTELRRQVVELAGRINPETQRPFSLEKIGELVGGLSRERVRIILQSEKTSKPSAKTALITEEKTGRIIGLALERDPITGLFLYSPKEIAKKTGAQLKQLLKIISKKIKGQRRTRLSPKTMEILRLGSLYSIRTKRPLYKLKEIAGMVGIATMPSVSARLIKRGMRRTLPKLK